jgi:hypothetical protein
MGSAIDINAPTNPYSRTNKLITDMRLTPVVRSWSGRPFGDQRTGATA